MFKKISNKISIKFSSVIIIVALIVNALIFNYLADFFTKRTIENKIFSVKRDMFSLQETLSFLVKYKKMAQLQKTVAYLGTHVDLEQALLVDENNQTIASARIENIGKNLKDLVSPEIFPFILKQQQRAKKSMKVLVWCTDNNNTLYAVAPLGLVEISDSLNHFKKTGFMMMKHDLTGSTKQQQQTIQYAFIPIVILLFFMGIMLAVFVHFYITKRIIRIKNAVDFFSKNSNKLRLKVSGSDEISELGHAFNAMANIVIEQQDNLHQYKNIVASSTDRLAMLDKQHIYKVVNPAYLQMFDLSAEQVIGKTPSDLFGADYYNEKRKKYAARCAAGEVVNFQQWVDLPKRGKRKMAITYLPYIDEYNQVQGFIINNRDITEQEKAQIELAESHSLLKNVINSTADIIVVKNNQLKIIVANNAYGALIGKPVVDVMGLTDIENGWDPLLIKGNAEENIRGFEVEDKQVLLGHEIHTPYEPITLNNKTIVFDTHKSPLKDQKGNIIGVLIISRNVTTQMQSLKKIKSQHQEQLQIVNAMFDAVITVNKLGTVLTINRATEALFGYSSDEMLGKNVKLLMPEHSAKKHDGHLQRYINEAKVGEKLSQEVNVQNKNKQIFPIRLSVSELPQDELGNRRFIAVCQDLTKIKHQEELFYRSQKMDALGKLTGGIAHDQNNMLGVILGYSEILKEQLQQQPRLLNYVEQIYQAGERGANLTHKLLSFSKQQAVQATPVNINDLIISNSDLLRKTLVLVELQLNLADYLWQVNIDKNSFQDMLLNMAINAMHAVKSTSNSGLLTICTANEHLSALSAKNLALQSGDYVSFSIEDNGCGMDAITRAKIFEPFFSTKGEKGTGLGLAQVYGFITSSGGAINVYSEVGHGTRFIVYFPRDMSHKLEHSKIENNKIANINGNEKILVVDDEPQLCDLVEEILSAKGYQVIVASTGEQALKILQKESIDLMLTDIIMPKMSGYQLAEQVSKLYANIIILFASGFQGDHIKERSETAEPVINKPYNAKILLTRIRQALNKRSINKTVKLAQQNVAQQDEHLSLNKLTQQSLQHHQWSQELSIDAGGILDKDHQQLYGFIKQLHNLAGNNSDHDDLQQILLMLIKNTKAHFAREELAMKACHYPYYKNHCNIHHLLIKKMESVVKLSSDSELLSWLIIDFPEIIVDHIKTMDKPLMPYLHANKDAVQQVLRGHDE
jgi:hemerythrin-like metal-binding protein/PAS domain S-box-containing protein